MTTLFLDFETRSRADIKKVGMYRYIWDASTELLCAGFAVDNALVHVEHGYLYGGLEHVLAARPRIVAHNIEFELECLKRFFSFTAPLAQWSCTAARSARMSLPRKLEEMAEAICLKNRKDTAGGSVMLRLSKPRRPSKDNLDEFWTPATKPDEFRKLYAYCAQDVETTREADGILPELSGQERRIWEVTTLCNQRGFKVDLASVRLARLDAEQAQRDLAESFEEITGVNVASSAQAAKALGLPDVTKATIRDALKTAEGLHKLELELRQKWARSSVKKLEAFEDRTSPDGRLRGSLTYFGASTGRWAGSGVQPQNFPKGLGKRSQDAFDALGVGLLPVLYQDVLGTISGMLRGFMVGPFLVGDYSQIEVRVLAWIAGQKDLLALFRSGGDPYCDMATSIFHRPVTKKDEKERFLGKQAVLSCFAAETMVLTHNGWKQITDVLPGDMVWAGGSWVAHEGVVPQGEQRITWMRGVGVTPDHKILTEYGWVSAKYVLGTNSTTFRSAQHEARRTPDEGKCWVAVDPRNDGQFEDADVYDLALAGPNKRYTIMTSEGPVVAHNCGYGVGASKFRDTLDEQHDTQIDEEMAQRIVTTYRSRYKSIVNLWYRVEKAFRFTVATGQGTRIGEGNDVCLQFGLQTVGGRPFAYILLPSGRSIWYAYPEIHEDRIRHLGRNQYKGGKWEMVETYGGKLVENFTQAVARDLLAAAFVDAEDEGLNPVLTVHDEVVAESDDADRFKKLMTRLPGWAGDLPLGAETFSCQRYRK